MLFCKQGFYHTPKGLVTLPSRDKATQQAEATKLFKFEDKEPLPALSVGPPYFYSLEQALTRYETKFQVLNADCVEVGLYLKKILQLNPVILNMCSPNLPGGGYTTFQFSG